MDVGPYIEAVGLSVAFAEIAGISRSALAPGAMFLRCSMCTERRLVRMSDCQEVSVGL